MVYIFDKCQQPTRFNHVHLFLASVRPYHNLDLSYLLYYKSQNYQIRWQCVFVPSQIKFILNVVEFVIYEIQSFTLAYV